MPYADFKIMRHTSGVGYFLCIPAEVEHRLTRERNFEEGEETISEGTYDVPTTFLDWDVNSPKVIYRWYIEGEETQEWECVPAPVRVWNVLGDPTVVAAANPIDPLMVFLSIRLGQMAARKQIRVRNPNHTRHFPVTKSYTFAEAALPAVGARYVAGQGRSADLGSLGMEQIGIELTVAAGTADEASEVGLALKGLRGEISEFLTYLGYYHVEFGGYFEEMVDVEPQAYSANVTYSMTAFMSNGLSCDYTDPIAGWRILPNVAHRIADDETVQLYTVD